MPATVNGSNSKTWLNGHSYGPHHSDSEERDVDDEDETELIDGFQPIAGASSGSFPELMPVLPVWSAKRHTSCGNPSPPHPGMPKMSPWRLRDKLKTSNAALVLCLNVEVDPPDVVKTNPCAVLECWVDPRTMPSSKALEAIGTNLHQQFEALNPRIKYKPYLDPSIEDTRKFCSSLRRMAKDERALFYYNGHGVPKPTPSGELWVFNKTYSQYIPVSLLEIQSWVGSPCIYIWECSAAGNLLDNFIKFAERRDQDAFSQNPSPDNYAPFLDSIQLAACKANETLPMCPELPADLFTSCLTSPMEIALRFFALHNQLPSDVTSDLVLRVPGDIKDRRTPLGELNWIFIAITDTIAWTTFPRHVFRRLYRQDLLVAALFRNFLLAERVMKCYQCTPHTYPPLPPTNTHPLWASWDLAVDGVIKQLPHLLAEKIPPKTGPLSPSTNTPQPSRTYTYVPSKFFEQNLTAFEVWLTRGGDALTKVGPHSLPPEATDPPEKNRGGLKERAAALKEREEEAKLPPGHGYLVPRKPPAQLPILLQVLLSQTHRLRALILLSQFVDLGPWAVNLALTIGIFPYVQKLLQAPAVELRPVLIFIWTRILAVDKSCQVDLLNSNGYQYFANVLAQVDTPGYLMISNDSEHRAMCCFVLAVLSRDYPQGQEACMSSNVFANCVLRLKEQDYLARHWAALCIALMWDGNDAIRAVGWKQSVHDTLLAMAKDDDSPEVRAATLFALSTYIGATGSPDEDKRGGGGVGAMPDVVDEEDILRMEVAIAAPALAAAKSDGSPMVRKEALVLVSCIVREWRGYLVVVAWIYWEETRRENASRGSAFRVPDDVAGHAIAQWLASQGDEETQNECRVLLASFYSIYVGILDLSVDPYPEVAALAQTIADWIMAHLLCSPFSRLGNSALRIPSSPVLSSAASIPPRSRVNSLTSSNGTVSSSTLVQRPAPKRAETATTTVSRVSSTLKRTSSILTNMAKGYTSFGAAQSDDGRVSPSSSTSTTVASTTTKSDKNVPEPHLNTLSYISPYDSGSGSEASRPPSSQGQFGAFEVFEALILDDMERLRSRRRQRQASTRRQPAVSGSQLQWFSGGPASDSSDGQSSCYGSDNGIREDLLPLKSRFFDWATEYFTEPQMRQQEQEEPGSVLYNQSTWRRQRNEKMQAETLTQSDVASRCRWDRAVASLHSHGSALRLAFHSFDTHLISSNEADVVSVFDWSKRKQLHTFSTGEPKAATITSLRFINEESGGIIVTASANGNVRLFRNYDPAYTEDEVELVSAFVGLDDRLFLKRGAGLVTDWNQQSARMICAGDSRSIKIWNADHEKASVVISTDSESPVTSLTSDPHSSAIFVAGFGDGSIRVYDKRQRPDDAVVRTYRDHTHWVQNVRWRRGGDKQLMSASVDGEIRLWDIRGDGPSFQPWNFVREGLAAFDVHDHADVFAASSALGSNNYKFQTITVHSMPPSNRPLSRHHVAGLNHPPSKSLPSAYIMSSTSLVFHPHEMLYGVGGADGTIRVFGCNMDKESAQPDAQGYRVEPVRSLSS